MKMNKKAVATAAIDRAAIDDGLRAYMRRVYGYMASGLALTGAVAYGVSSSRLAMEIIFGTPLFWVVIFAPIGVLFFLDDAIESTKADTAQTVFWTYAGLMGLSLSAIFIEYTGTSIARVFFLTAGVFAGMSLYGYATRRDLTGWGSFFFMGLIGVIVAMVVNMFLQSAAMHFVTSAVGVLVFVGLTAHDTQAIKSIYMDSDDLEVRETKAIFGALVLYLNFLNLLLQLLSLFGEGEQ